MINASAMWSRCGVVVDPHACPTRWGRCYCGLCAVCGFAKHMAIHGGVLGDAPGGRPYGHEFLSDKGACVMDAVIIPAKTIVHINGIPVRLAVDTLVETANMSLLTGYHYAHLGSEPEGAIAEGQTLPSIPA